METINQILEKITDTWNNYFWDFKYCQDQINFNTAIKTNYYGDILSYFNDTLNLLTDIKYEKDFQKSIFQAIGILQIIYTQQDLLDELLYIFKLPASTKKDKSPNREIRNELIGHPIRRDTKTKEFISSVFYGREFNQGTIHYILYSKKNNYSGETYTYEFDEIINSHKIFLEKYLDVLRKHIGVILKRLKKELLKLNDLVNKNIDFYKLLTFVEQRYEKISKENYLFKREILESCFVRQDEHPRYKNVIESFTNALKENIPDIIDDIDEMFEPRAEEVSEPQKPIKVVISDVKGEVKPLEEWQH